MTRRNNQRALWSDREFIKKLEVIKAKRLLNGNPANSLAQLTEEIIKCPSFDNLEQELINFNIKMPGVKFDKRRRIF